MFSKTLKDKRTALNITQKELAEQIGVTKAAISQFENGVSAPKVSTIIKIAKALNCTETELLGGHLE